ncbi:hypothetical protein [Actinotalea sp. K2]|uniref:hypothetical protein n=1 Tax=Actinotalea sp. K2 TaxID=2939438 RepID=UPI00201802AC|nr:hypothetical protein [Actinotalea sp. K2]MCL3862499.1 hypothetical protein [Actinotalea sp. K2]
MILDLAALTASTSELLASSGSSDGDGSGFAYLFLLSGFIFYGAMFVRYRNTDKRHRHESETKASMHDVRAADQFHRSLRGVSNARMKGANNRQVHGARRGLSQTLGLDQD